MDPFADNFIDYDCQYELKHESLFEPEFTMSPPFSENSDINGVFGGFFNKTVKNILDPEEEAPRKQSYASDANQLNGGNQPFQIGRYFPLMNLNFSSKKKEEGFNRVF